MDLEFMVLDTFDQIRPSSSFKKYESFTELEAACQKIEAFEKKVFQTGSLGSKNLMSTLDS